jgi:hypothetical protein
VTIEPDSPAACIRFASPMAAHRFVPVEPPARRPITRSSQRIAPRLAASGTGITASTSSRTNEGSTRGRPMPSIREPRGLVIDASPSRWYAWNTEDSGSATAIRVAA